MTSLFYNRRSLGDYIVLPIERIHSSGSDWQERIIRLKPKTFWADNMDLLQPTGLNKKTFGKYIRISRIEWHYSCSNAVF